MEIYFKISDYKTKYGFSHLSDERFDITTLFMGGTVKSYFPKVPEISESNYSGEVFGELKTKIVDDFIFDDMKKIFSNAIGYFAINRSSLILEIGHKQISDFLSLKELTFKIDLVANKVWSETTAFSVSRPQDIAVIITEDYVAIPINSYEISTNV